MKTILVVVGSWRKGGNTDQLAGAFIKGAEQAGHRVVKAFLGDKNINGCNGCNSCLYGKPCVQKDDMREIYPLLEQCDMIVLASPLYFWAITARTKAFLERLYATGQKDDHPPKGRYLYYPEKDCALLMTAADDNFWTFEHAISYYRLSCVNYLGWNDRGILLAGGCGGSPSSRRIEDTGHLNSAFQFGSSL